MKKVTKFCLLILLVCNLSGCSEKYECENPILIKWEYRYIWNKENWRTQVKGACFEKMAGNAFYACDEKGEDCQWYPDVHYSFEKL